MRMKIYAVYGERTYEKDYAGNWYYQNHLQAVSFQKSRVFRHDDGTFTAVINADLTETHDYSIVIVCASDAVNCYLELNAQLSDGIFENYKTGKVVELL